MSMPALPPLPPTYNQRLPGVYGEFGWSAGICVFYLQTTMSPNDLYNKTTLISDIPGSERWSVRNLFQRDVDNDRVKNDLIPYLRNPDQIKFFSPLTLTILPFSERETDKSIWMVSQVSQLEGETEWLEWTFGELYRFRHMKNSPYGQVEWNDSKTKLVAIDGQHRLSAVRRIARDSDSPEGIQNWNIPVVILSCAMDQQERPNQSILGVVRNVFIYINREAKKPTIARQILLTDSEINAICVQELLEMSHENDDLEPRARSEEIPPLAIYDWRETSDNEFSPILFKIEEIHAWMKHYILGEDYDDKQEKALAIQPIDSVKNAFMKKSLSLDDAEEVRKVVKDRLNPGIVHLLSNFKPLRDYISGIRKIESDLENESDISRHALSQLRFGSNRGEEANKEDIEELLRASRKKMDDLKRDIPYPFGMEIGMRGVMSAFGDEDLRDCLVALRGGQVSWLEYAEWFTESLNYAYDNGYLGTDSRKRQRLLRHVIEDHNETVVNYRLEKAGDAFGAFVKLFIAAYALSRGELRGESLRDPEDGVLDGVLEKLNTTIFRGYKKQVRPRLMEENRELSLAELKEAVIEEATQLTKKHIKKIQNEVDKVTGSSSP